MKTSSLRWPRCRGSARRRSPRLFWASCKLFGSDVAQSEMTYQSLLLEFGEHGQGFFNGSFRWPHDSSDAQIDDIERVESEIAKIVVNAIDQFLARKSMNPGLVFATSSAYLGDDHQTVRIGMERLLDDLVGHMRTIKVAGIDMVHAGGDRLSQNGDRSVDIARRSPHLRTGKLHRTVAHAVHGHRCAWEGEGCRRELLDCVSFLFLLICSNVVANLATCG